MSVAFDDTDSQLTPSPIPLPVEDTAKLEEVKVRAVWVRRRALRGSPALLGLRACSDESRVNLTNLRNTKVFFVFIDASDYLFVFRVKSIK